MQLLIEVLKAVVLGIVQGITEWLPISSTGHLILVNQVMPLSVFSDAAMNTEFINMFTVVIQLGSILAVLVLYFNELNPWASGKSAEQKKSTWQMWIKIVIAAIPAGLAGILFDDMIDAYLYNATVVAIALIVYGVIFIVMENRTRHITTRSIDGMSRKTAFGIGVFQMLALIPGTSRSGSTIIGATALGCSRSTAAKFSFFLAIPMMFGASLVKLVKTDVTWTMEAVIVLLTGMIVSFIVSVVVIRSFMKYIRKHSFKLFGVYRIVLGILVLVLIAMQILPNALA